MRRRLEARVTACRRRVSAQTSALVRGPVTVELGLASGATRSFADVPVAADGSISVDAGGDAAMVRTVRIIDRFGNRGDATP